MLRRRVYKALRQAVYVAQDRNSQSTRWKSGTRKTVHSKSKARLSHPYRVTTCFMLVSYMNHKGMHSIWMYIYIYTYICLYIYIYMCINIYIYTYRICKQCDRPMVAAGCGSTLKSTWQGAVAYQSCQDCDEEVEAGSKGGPVLTGFFVMFCICS